MKDKDKVGVYKFFQGELTEYEGIIFDPHNHWLGLIEIKTKTKHNIMCSTKPGIIRNNFVWFEGGLSEENKLKAIYIFKERVDKMFDEYHTKLDDLTYDRYYLDDQLICIRD